MSKTLRTLALLPCLLALLAATGHTAQVGAPLPDFTVRTLAGGELSRATLSGKPALLVFWNTWCDTCKKELPKVNLTAQKFGPGRLTVLAINTGLNDSEAKARAYWQKYGYSFTAGYDYSFEVGKNFKVMGVPTVVLVDARGVVRYNASALPLDLEERLAQLIGPR
jgi:thiol-disulfide isomerase/thioredoxin